jgi:hypothetical protein
MTLFMVRTAHSTIYTYGACLVIMYDRAPWHDDETAHFFVSQFAGARGQDAEEINRDMFDRNVLD